MKKDKSNSPLLQLWGSIITNKKLILLTIVLFFLYFSPYLIKGKNSFVQIHDNLNQINQFNIFERKFQGAIFPSAKIPDATLPGVDPIFRVGPISITKLFFAFDYFRGYVFNEFFYRLLGFLGLFYLLKIFTNNSKFPDYLLLLISFSFVALPFWPPGHLSIAGIPLLMLAFYNFYHHKNLLISYLFMILYAFYSNLLASGIFIFFIVLFVYIYLLFKRKLNKHLVFGAILLFACFIVSHYPFFLIQFVYKIPTNRITQSFSGFGLFETLKRIFTHFISSHTAAQSFHARFILQSSIIIMFLLFFYRKFRYLKLILLLWGYLLFSSIIFGIYYYRPFLDFYNELEIGFRVERFYFLNPPVWFILWGILLIEFYEIMKNKKTAQIILIILISIQIGYCLKNSTIKAYFGKPSFKEFFAGEQFAEIETKLEGNKKEYRIGCIGFFPAIANYNGFKTVDSFSVFYPLEFKQEFYEIIKDELKQNPEIEDFFLNWGIQVLLFDDKTGKNYYDQDFIKQNINEIKCDLKIEKLKDFKVKYLFSTVSISNFKEIGLEKVYENTNPENYYRFFVYRIKT